MYFQAKDYSPVPAGTKVAFIGLGTMGFPMAGHLLHAAVRLPFITARPLKPKPG